MTKKGIFILAALIAILCCYLLIAYNQEDLSFSDETSAYITQMELVQPTWTELWVEDGKLFVETQDGKWFIKMEEVDE